jgi:hypothetical protein
MICSLHAERLRLVSGLVKTAEIDLHRPGAAESRVQSSVSVLVIASNSERLGQRVIEYCSSRRDDFPAKLKSADRVCSKSV